MYKRQDWTYHTKEIQDNIEAMEAAETTVKVAGRVMAIRGHGKTCFLDLQDKTGKIQLYARKDNLGEENYLVIKLMDIGCLLYTSRYGTDLCPRERIVENEEPCLCQDSGDVR